ncbi:MAG: hypothetical protein CVU39_12840 [Chloroflexi bacterium HGW-Chloroflexi-10]|nr:MAG: hypothetical protein CVU39_12840 [Chloroflexi bacterium HGW-Chloroflexi-10]
MSENDLAYLEEEKPKKLQFGWFFPIFIRPRRVMAEIAEKNHAVWLAPLLILMISAVVLVLVSAPLIGQASQVVPDPEMNQYFTPEQQDSINQAASMGTSPVMTMVFPLLGKFAGIWIGWFLLGSILHLSLTLNGSRSSNRSSLNVVAWAGIPFVLRDIVQIVAILVTKQLITKPGLSGFMADGVSGGGAFLGAILAFIDLYLIWQIVLMVIGAGKVSGMKPVKVWLATLIAMVIFLALKALPVFLGAQLGSLAGG